MIVESAAANDLAVSVVGDFVVPPHDGPVSRDFQTLHFDFGLPLAPVVAADIARFTALHVSAGAPPSGAVTRLVPLRSLLAGGPWPDCDELIRRFTAYGNSYGAWDDDAGYVEGSLARIVEAALGQAPVLPSVKAQPGFLCGKSSPPWPTSSRSSPDEVYASRPSRSPCVPASCWSSTTSRSRMGAAGPADPANSTNASSDIGRSPCISNSSSATACSTASPPDRP